MSTAQTPIEQTRAIIEDGTMSEDPEVRRVAYAAIAMGWWACTALDDERYDHAAWCRRVRYRWPGESAATEG